VGAGKIRLWLTGHHAWRERRCDECGQTWTIGKPEKPSHFEGIELTPHLQSAALIGEQIAASEQEHAEVREALARCPECGSEHFTESRIAR
jgi:uncharacterized Zn finger protein